MFDWYCTCSFKLARVESHSVVPPSSFTFKVVVKLTKMGIVSCLNLGGHNISDMEFNTILFIFMQIEFSNTSGQHKQPVNQPEQHTAICCHAQSSDSTLSI